MTHGVQDVTTNVHEHFEQSIFSCVPHSGAVVLYDLPSFSKQEKKSSAGKYWKLLGNTWCKSCLAGGFNPAASLLPGRLPFPGWQYKVARGNTVCKFQVILTEKNPPTFDCKHMLEGALRALSHSGKLFTSFPLHCTNCVGM